VELNRKWLAIYSAVPMIAHRPHAVVVEDPKLVATRILGEIREFAFQQTLDLDDDDGATLNCSKTVGMFVPGTGTLRTM
jgi:hypothetical protein